MSVVESAEWNLLFFEPLSHDLLLFVASRFIPSSRCRGRRRERERSYETLHHRCREGIRPR